jgi:hypothetical protein
MELGCTKVVVSYFSLLLLPPLLLSVEFSPVSSSFFLILFPHPSSSGSRKALGARERGGDDDGIYGGYGGEEGGGEGGEGMGEQYEDFPMVLESCVSELVCRHGLVPAKPIIPTQLDVRQR